MATQRPTYTKEESKLSQEILTVYGVWQIKIASSINRDHPKKYKCFLSKTGKDKLTLSIRLD